MLDDLYGKERFCQDQPEPQAVWLGIVTGWRPVKPPAMPEATSLLNSRGQNTRSTTSMVQRVFSYNLPGQSQPGVAIRSRARLTFPVRHKARARNRRPGLRLEHVTSWRVERDGSTDPGSAATKATPLFFSLCRQAQCFSFCFFFFSSFFL